MDNTIHFRVTVDVRGGKIHRLRLWERDADGKRVRLQRPLRTSDVANLKAAHSAVNLLAKGVSDTVDIVANVNANGAKSRKKKKAHHAVKTANANSTARGTEAEGEWE